MIRILATLMLLVATGSSALIQAPAATPPGHLPRPQPQIFAIDSLYAARDTSGLTKAVAAWNGEETPRIRFYRGIAAAWNRRASLAISLLRPVVDSSRSSLTPDETRDALRALTESYGRTRNYSEPSELYEKELLDADSAAHAALDSVKARARAAADSAAQSSMLDALTSPDPVPSPAPAKIPDQVGLIGLLFALFLVPKLLQRYRIPGAVTALIMGAAASRLGWFTDGLALRLLSTLGIVSLFLFAGLEIDGRELRQSRKPLMLHAAVWTVLATVVALVCASILGTSLRVSALISLALVTPSTGFILSSLSTFGLSPVEQKTVRTYAIGSELIALAALFFIIQSTSVRQLSLSIAAMTGVVVVIPLTFRAFASLVAPYAQRSEFAFLLMVAVACAYATRLLGVYYLVGAFLVGVAAQRFRGHHPAMSSEKMVDALESFGSVFIPFYFFHAGLEISVEHFGARALALGIGLVAVVVPIRVAVIALHRKFALGETVGASRRIGSAMVPTLVFTLVILAILVEKFEVSATVAGGLVLYTVLNTTIPAFVLRSEPPDFEDVEALPIEPPLISE